MTCARHRAAMVVALMSAALGLAACGGNGTTARSRSDTGKVPEHILRAPKSMLAAAEPQPNGIMWALAGKRSAGLFAMDSASGQVTGSVSVSNTARSVAESSTGVLGVALGTSRSGALALLNGRTAKLLQTVPLPAPARQVVAGSDGTTFYVLTGWATSASVSIVGSQSGKVEGTVPVPADAVAAVPDVQQTLLYVLERDGRISEITISGGKVMARFSVGDLGRALAVSPDGGTLYVLKGTAEVANIAVVDVATESVRRVLPAPGHCVEILVSASGNQLYEVVGTAGYGNIQVFAA
jgi:DNA-binding beta-propeller fold protein YncE